MNRLLTANLIRLRKNRGFWFFTLCSLIVTIWYVAFGVEIIGVQSVEASPEEFLFFVQAAVPALCLLFVGFFLGTEYSNKTIRNKLAVGHTRKDVYIASLLTVLVITAVMTLAWLLGGMVGIAMRGTTIPVARVLLGGLVALFYNSAFTALLTAMSMLIAKKAISMLVQIELTRFLLTGMLMVMLIAGMMEGRGKILFEILANVVPIGQWMLSTNLFPCQAAAMPLQMLASVVLVVLFTFLGIKMFEEKEIK